MANALANIPFLAGYEASGQMGDARQAAETKQIGTLVGLHEQLRARQQETQLREALAASGGDLERAMQAALNAGNINGAAKIGQLIEARKKVQPQGQSIGSGGLLLPDGRIIPPAEAPAKKPAVGTVRQRYDGENVIQEELQADGTYKEIGRGPRFAKSVGPQITMPQPVTPVTIQDPNDPNGTIVIDGRTRQVLGKGPKLTEVGKLNVTREFNMQGIGKIIQEADDLLSGKDGKPLPTGSGVGTAVDFVGGLVGMSPEGSVEAQRLKAIGGALTTKMPRMEGPQSDRDVVLYREMAAMVGDSTVPVARRKAALETVKGLWAKYEKLNPEAFASGQGTPTPPGGGDLRDFPSEAAARAAGFKNGDRVKINGRAGTLR